MKSEQIKVWDLVIRSFHWLLVLAFVIAYVTEDELMLHSYAGYTVLILVVLRIIYGFVGSKHARFNDFIYSPYTALIYIKDVFLFKPKRYLGHNPAGGLMIIILLISLIATSISGMIALAMEENAGPLVSFVTVWPYWLNAGAENIHEFLAHFSLLLIMVHVTGVIVESIVHGENLAKSMINGRKTPELRD